MRQRPDVARLLHDAFVGWGGYHAAAVEGLRGWGWGAARRGAARERQLHPSAGLKPCARLSALRERAAVTRRAASPFPAPVIKRTACTPP